MRKLIKYLVIVLLLLTILYYGIGLYQARQYTLQTIIPQLRVTHFSLEPADLSPRQLQILLAVEDPKFFTHHGVDFRTPGAGITTLTQGLVKLLYFRSFKPGLAKIRQTLIAALVLDPLVSKSDQLRLFINCIYLGHGAKGFEAAAQVYYHKSFSQLTENEYISLIALIIAPQTFDPIKYPERNALRVARITKLVNGEYQPRGLFDLFYGQLDSATRQGIPPLSYFSGYYSD